MFILHRVWHDVAMNNEAERRKKIRVPLSKTIKHSKYQVLGTPVFQENSSIDLSSGGIAFETVQEYAHGTLVLLEVEIDEEPLKLLVCVARVSELERDGEKRFEIGAELIAIDPEHKKKLQLHLGKLIRGIKIKNQTKAKKKPAAKKTSRKAAVKKKYTKNKKVVKKKVQKKTVLKKKVVGKKKSAKKKIAKKRK